MLALTIVAIVLLSIMTLFNIVRFIGDDTEEERVFCAAHLVALVLAIVTLSLRL